MSDASSIGNNRNIIALSSLNPELIHRVLLTDPSQFMSLTVSGNPRIMNTPTYSDFSMALTSFGMEHDPLDMAMKRAFRDHICEVVYTNRDMEPLHKLLLELHEMLRSLVPNRRDLHSILVDDGKILQVDSPPALSEFVLDAATALAQLESEVRAETTNAWIEQARNMDVKTAELKSAIEFITTSLLYLLYKAELCDQDKNNFYLGHVWAPRIQAEGPEYERQVFQSRFGSLENEDTAPLTRAWIRTLIEQRGGSPEDLRNDPAAREAFLKQSWVEDILFRGTERAALSLPEILDMDLGRIQSIREVTRTAAAGSALALHACNASGSNSMVLSKPVEPLSSLELRRMAVADAMANRNRGRKREDYESDVGHAVIALAKEWNPSLSHDAEVSLQSRTISVLRGEDPVIRLLDSRMKETFSILVVKKELLVPLGMQSGILDQEGNRKVTSIDLFRDEAQKEFCRRGLSFYAYELATASIMAKQVIDLAWKVYGVKLLDKIIVNACGATSNIQETEP